MSFQIPESRTLSPPPPPPQLRKGIVFVSRDTSSFMWPLGADGVSGSPWAQFPGALTTTPAWPNVKRGAPQAPQIPVPGPARAPPQPLCTTDSVAPQSTWDNQDVDVENDNDTNNETYNETYLPENFDPGVCQYCSHGRPAQGLFSNSFNLVTGLARNTGDGARGVNAGVNSVANGLYKGGTGMYNFGKLVKSRFKKSTPDKKEETGKPGK